MYEYLLHILILINIYAILSMSFSLALGYTGLPVFAQPAFFAVGAYAAAFMSAGGVSFWLEIFLSGAIAGLVAYLMSFAALQLRGDYFAIVTLGFSEITRLALLNESARYSAAGDVGIVGVARPMLFGFDFNSLPHFFLLALGFMLATYLVLRRLVASPYGRVIRAIKDDEDVTEVIGKDTRRFKVEVLVLVGFFAGIAGSLWAHYIQFVHPTQFTPDLLVFVLASVVLFNEASIPGAIFGAAFMVTFPELMRFFGLPEGSIGALRLLIMGVTVVVIILIREHRRGRNGGRTVASE
jgi:branched-chain amino acid transport system permease protein